MSVNSKKSIQSEKYKYQNPLSSQTLSINSNKTNSTHLSEIYKNTLNNIEDLITISNLKKGNCFKIFNDFYCKLNEENKELLELYTNEEKMKEVIDKDNTWKINDDLFEDLTLNILSDYYNLNEYNLYPYFDVTYSKTKKSNVIKFYYNVVDFWVDNIKSPESVIFSDDRDIYIVNFQNIPLIFEKYNGEFYTVTVLSEDFQYYNEFQMTKTGKIQETSFIFAEINSDLMKTKNKIKEMENKKDSLDKKEEKEKEELDKKIKSYKRILESQKAIYSKKNIENKLEVKKNELIILEEKIKLKEKEHEIEKEEIQKKTEIKEEIFKYEKLLRKFTIKIERHDKELDGLFFSSKEITLENTIGDKLTIPAERPIIVEVKNIIKYRTIVENIIKKKRLMKVLGYQVDDFYFIGILRGIDIDQEEKKNINSKIFNNIASNNIIVIYPEKLNFLNIPLIGIKKEKKEEVKKEEEKKGENLLDKVKELIKNEFLQMKTEMKKEMRNEINEVKNEINGMKKEMNEMKNNMNGMKNDINGLKTDMNGMKNDINGLKNDMNGMKNDINGLKNDINGLKGEIKVLKDGKI